MLKKLIGYHLVRMSELQLQDIATFTSANFTAHDPMMRHLGLRPQQMKSLSAPLYEACHSSPFSFAFLKDQQIASVMLNCPYMTFMEVFQSVPDASIPKQLKPGMAIIESLKQKYQPKDPKKTIALFIGCTDPKHAGNNFLQRLTLQTEKVGKQKGYVEYIADCTNNISQNVLKKIGYQQKAEIEYDKFVFEGKYPFKGLKDHKSLKLMSKVKE